jgi:hypothetical protein
MPAAWLRRKVFQLCDARGMTTREVAGHIGELYGTEISPHLVSAVTEMSTVGADKSTLALLTYLGLRIAQLPLVIIATHRDGVSEDNPALTQTLEELIRQGIRPLKLTGLSKDSVAQMLDQLSQRNGPRHDLDDGGLHSRTTLPPPRGRS